MKGLLSSVCLGAAFRTVAAFVPVPPMIHLKQDSFGGMADLASPPPPTGYFFQPLDHENPALGNFSLRYFYSSAYWGGPGYPVSQNA